jgi:hypothetical protein
MSSALRSTNAFRQGNDRDWLLLPGMNGRYQLSNEPIIIFRLLQIPLDNRNSKPVSRDPDAAPEW